VSLLFIGRSNAAQLAKAVPPHHTENGFRNYPPTPGDAVPDIGFIWRRMFFGDLREMPSNHVISEPLSLSNLDLFKDENSITWIGHATFLINLNGKYILTDPFFSKSVSPFLGPKRFVPPGISLKNLSLIDFIIISHNHCNHLDADAIEELPNRHKIKVLVPLGLGAFFKESRYSTVYEVDWEGQVSIDNIKFTALPAVHDSGRGPFDENETLWCSWAIDHLDRKIYFAGDTGYSPIISKKLEKPPMDLIMPYYLSVHMNPET